jgi:hypothetical protein
VALSGVLALVVVAALPSDTKWWFIPVQIITVLLALFLWLPVWPVRALELLKSVRGYNFDPGTNVVDVYVRRLRTKLGQSVIETLRNVGYSSAAAARR